MGTIPKFFQKDWNRLKQINKSQKELLASVGLLRDKRGAEEARRRGQEGE